VKIANGPLNKTTQSHKLPSGRIFIVDDHALVRQGMMGLINKQSDLMVCGEADNAASALSQLSSLKPDLAIVDISLKHGDGFELIRNIRLNEPDVLILVVSMHDETANAELALHAGARGYIMKDQAIESVIVAIRRVLSGKIYLSEEMTLRLLQQKIEGRGQASPVELLSERELQVFQLIGRWRRTRQIAEELHLSIKTVEYYRERIKTKLNLRNGTELTQFATQWIQTNTVG
jgi:DNA-binding NarL/FixJ family response regulator